MLRPLLIYTIALITALLFLPTAKASDLILTSAPGHFVSGSQSSCVDLVESKATKSPAKTSVEPQGFLIEGITLDWTSNDILNVDTVRAVISDGHGNRAVLELPPDEIRVLLGHEQASVQGPEKIVTNDPARSTDPTLVPCGLAYGGVNWLNPAEALKVVLSIIGTSERKNGDLAPLEVSIETSIQP